MAEASYYRIKGFPVKCHRCGHGQFRKLSFQLTESLFDDIPPALDETVDHLQCANCRHLHRFARGLAVPDD